jgi:hypothetical protein
MRRVGDRRQVTHEILELLKAAFDDASLLPVLADFLEERGAHEADVVRAMTLPLEVARILLGSEVSAAEALTLPISDLEKLELVLRRDVLGDQQYSKLAVEFAEHVLPRFEGVFPDDRRPRNAIELARKSWVGGVTVQDLHEATDGVTRAVRAAHRFPPAAFAASAVRAAVEDGDAEHAAYLAVQANGEGETQWQVQRLALMLEKG